MAKGLAKLSRRVAQRKSHRRDIYTRLSRDVLAATKELNPNDPAEDFWMLHDLSGILFTLGQVDPVEGQHRLNVFLNQLRTLQLPIRDLQPPAPEPPAPRLKGKH